MSKLKAQKAGRAIADALGLSHFVVANLIAILGHFTSLFSFMKTSTPGVDFVKTYICAPAIPLLTWLLVLIQSLTEWTTFFIYSLFSLFSDSRILEAAKPGFSFVEDFFKDTSTIGIMLSTEAVIIFASVLYWLVCYISVRIIIATTA
jgi:hypothetical protein